MDVCRCAHQCKLTSAWLHAPPLCLQELLQGVGSKSALAELALQLDFNGWYCRQRRAAPAGAAAGGSSGAG